MLHHVVARRAGRVAFGAVLIAGALMLAGAAYDDFKSVPAWQIVVGTWLVAATGGLAVTFVASRLSPGGNPDALRGAALAAPAVGLALVLPLTLLMPFFVVGEPRAFDEFCMVALFLAGHTHLVLAGLVFVRALQLVAGKPPVRPRTVFFATTAAGLIPFLLPVAYTAPIAVLCFPMLALMDDAAARDRAASHQVPMATLRAAR